MGLKSLARKTIGTVIGRYNYEIVDSRQVYDWQLNPDTRPSYKQSDLPHEAADYLQPGNPRLNDLQARYAAFNNKVTAPLVWTDSLVRPEDILYFRGDNAYVWQLRGPNMNSMAYALATYYVKSIDHLGLLEILKEDNYFGNFTYDIDTKIISRDLLDSVMEIYFLEKHLGISAAKSLSMLDIGAGYGRLANRMVRAMPNVTSYLCTDGVAVSTFISEYYLRFRAVDGTAEAVPLDEIEEKLGSRKTDIAINIHSFSECTIPAIEWWLSLLQKYRVKHLMIVPNSGNHAGERLSTNDGHDMGAVIQNHGYKLIAKEPKYRDSYVQKYAINPTHHYLFELE